MFSILGSEVKMTVSSAYNIDSVCLVMVGRSLMYIINNSGPSMLPCGTPVVDGNGADVFWPMFIIWVLSDMYDDRILWAEGAR